MGRSEGFNDRCLGSSEKFTWVPRKCYASGKIIWLTKAIKRTALWTGTGMPIWAHTTVWEHRWYNKHVYLTLKLKGEL